MGWVAIALLAACGGEDDPGVTGPDPAVQPFVGTWDAEHFTVTSDAEPPEVADLLISGSFNLDVQPSGTYTGILVFGSLSPVVEIGQLMVTDNFVTLSPNGENPCPGSSEFVFSGPDYVTLDGPTCFDFNRDGELEAARAHIELRRR